MARRLFYFLQGAISFFLDLVGNMKYLS